MTPEETIYLQQLENKNQFLISEVKSLKEQLDWFQRQFFGQRSEREIPMPNDQQLLLDIVESFKGTPPEEEVETVPAHQRRKPKRHGKDSLTLPDDLPVKTTIIDVPKEERKDPETGELSEKIGEEVTRKLAHTPGSYYIKEYIRPKYAFLNREEDGIVCAELPDTVLPRSRADESLLADILTKKYADHLPLYRIIEDFSRNGIGISKQLLSQWVLKCGKALHPLFKEMQKRVLGSGNIFIDETPISLLDPGKGKTHEAYMWVIVGGKNSNPAYRIYNFRLDRKHKHASDLLKDYKGITHSDKYGAYIVLAEKGQFVWCPCWSHIRRKFFEANTGDPPFRKWVLRKIRYLFMLERVAWNRSTEERLRIRQELEIPIIDELIAAIKRRLVDGKILPKSKLKTALGYFCGLIPYLKNYTTDPWARLDNNVAERAIRPLAIGRKNWLFMGSKEAGEAAATVLSLVQTCRALNINPRVYLEDVLRRIMGHSAKRLDELLPDQWLAAHSNDTRWVFYNQTISWKEEPCNGVMPFRHLCLQAYVFF